MLYFTFATVYGWLVLKDTEFLYPQLGGPSGGGIHRLSEVSVFASHEKRLYDYFLITWGFHCRNMVHHVFFEQPGSDFKEVMIHHLATFFLYFNGVQANILVLGGVVSYLHDIPEVLVTLGRISGSLRQVKLFSVVAFSLLVVTWAVTRCWTLSLIVYQVFTNMHWEEQYAQFQPFYIFVGLFLSVLTCLHYFWFYLILQILRRYVTQGKTDDITNKVETPRQNKTTKDD